MPGHTKKGASTDDAPAASDDIKKSGRAVRVTLKGAPTHMAEQVVLELRERLTTLHDGKTKSDLLRRLERLGAAIDRWKALPPSDAQRDAMLEQLYEIEADIACDTPTDPPPPPGRSRDSR